MQAYILKLNENHSALPSQVTKDGYLADENGKAEVYNYTAAKDKANLFGGTPEKFGKNHTVSKRKILQFDQNFLNQKIVELAREKEAFEGKNGDFICYGVIFDDLLELGGLSADIVEELRCLSVFCVEADYVQFLS